jgi:hypothetical protein
MGRTSQMPKEIAQLAGRQHGILTRAQVHAGKRSDAWIHRQVRRGVLVRVHHGVYAVGYRRLDPPARAMAAVLACGPGALLSHESEAALWGWRRWPAIPEVTTASDRRPRGIRAHRSTTLTPADHDRQFGVPVTSPHRTMRDLRPRMNPATFRRMVSDASYAGLLDGDSGARLLGDGPTPTRSALQDLFQRRVIDPHDLPQPLIDVVVNGFEVDAAWPEARLVVEIDGWDAHGGPVAFATDRERDAVHAEHGWLVVRITWERLRDRPHREAARLGRILAARTQTDRAQ